MDDSTATGLSHEAFARDGFAVVRDVLNHEQVAGLRSLCGDLMTAKGKQELLPKVFLDTPELIATVLRDEVVDALSTALGGPVSLYPNLTVRKSLYIGWHIDEAFAGPGKEYVWDSGFAHVQAAIYLQDNDEEHGGGIDVVPGSHMTSVDGYGQCRPDFTRALANVPAGREPIRVDSRAGDLVLWHARLLHASTPSQSPEESGAPTKLGVFLSAGRPDRYENNRFLSHLAAKRIQLDDGKQVEYPRHGQVLDIRFPESYSEETLARIEEVGLSVASF